MYTEYIYVIYVRIYNVSAVKYENKTNINVACFETYTLNQYWYFIYTKRKNS